jgi:hypothetical protein
MRRLQAKASEVEFNFDPTFLLPSARDHDGWYSILRRIIEIKNMSPIRP